MSFYENRTTLESGRAFRELKPRKAKFGFEATLRFERIQELARCQLLFDKYIVAGDAWLEIRNGANIYTIVIYTDDQATRDALYQEIVND